MKPRNKHIIEGTAVGGALLALLLWLKYGRGSPVNGTSPVVTVASIGCARPESPQNYIVKVAGSGGTATYTLTEDVTIINANTGAVLSKSSQTFPWNADGTFDQTLGGWPGNTQFLVQLTDNYTGKTSNLGSYQTPNRPCSVT